MVYIYLFCFVLYIYFYTEFMIFICPMYLLCLFPDFHILIMIITVTQLV